MAVAAQRRPTPKILVVDDDDDICELVARELKDGQLIKELPKGGPSGDDKSPQGERM